MIEKTVTRLRVYHTVESYFDLDFDLREAHEWYVKWNVLHIQRKPDSEFESIEPTCDGLEDDVESFKHATEEILVVMDENGSEDEFISLY